MNQIASTRNRTKAKAYLPDLEQLLSQCEMNYWLCERVWPEIFEAERAAKKSITGDLPVTKEGNEFSFSNDVISLHGEIKDRAKYTTTMNLSIDVYNGVISKPMSLIIRIYHDAKMMEVMEGSGPGTLKAIYTDDRQKRQADEKRQSNQFVGECLRACLK